MQAHIVLAHPESKSFNGHLARVARATLEQRGWSVTLSDLEAQGFDPCERAAHFTDRADPDRFEPQTEQRHASNGGSIPPDVQAEIDRLAAADLVILQYPMWWHLPPAMLKGWFDRVFIYGAVYKSDMRFEKGRFTAKKAMLSVTVATSRETYAFDGRSGDIDMLCWPVNFSLAYVGFDVLRPQVHYGVESGLRYSGASEIEARLKRVEADYVARLQAVESEPAIPFNRMAEWGGDGRIKPGAPVYSPFIRRRERLEIE